MYEKKNPQFPKIIEIDPNGLILLLQLPLQSPGRDFSFTGAAAFAVHIIGKMTSGPMYLKCMASQRNPFFNLLSLWNWGFKRLFRVLRGTIRLVRRRRRFTIITVQD